MEEEGIDPSTVNRNPKVIKGIYILKFSYSFYCFNNIYWSKLVVNLHHVSSFSAAAQEEISCMDVLVCGKCHVVFHFIEEFQGHKEKNECGSPVFKANLSVCNN